MHRRWGRFIKSFIAANERLAYIDIRIHQQSYRICTAYFPHAAYAQAHVARVHMHVACARARLPVCARLRVRLTRTRALTAGARALGLGPVARGGPKPKP